MSTYEQQAQTFGEAVRRARTARGLSQEGLGLACGMSRTYVGGIERGERNPSLEAIHRLATTLDVPIQELFS